MSGLLFKNKMTIKKEEEIREAKKCIGCDKEKQKGCIVCWNCFKYIDNPFKYFKGSLSEWLETIKA